MSRDPYHVEVKLRPGARASLRALRDRCTVDPAVVQPAFMPVCLKRGCTEPAVYSVKGQDFCWSHAKEAAGWRE